MVTVEQGNSKKTPSRVQDQC